MGRALFFSLLLALASSSSAASLREIEAELRGKSGPAAQNAASRLLKSADGNQAYVTRLLEQIQATGDAQALQELRSSIKLRLESDNGDRVPQAQEASQVAAEIKKNPLYRDESDVKRDNWLQRSLQRIADLLRRQPRQQSETMVDDAGGSGTSFDFTVIAWILLITLAVVGVVFAMRYAIVKGGWKRSAAKSGALLDDDEPDRTADEWLDQADALAAQGKFREAVRALYLACLVKLDEGRISRFIRGETNWEHVRRYEASPRRLDIDFREPSLRFDIVWYGYQTRGIDDVNYMKEVYRQTCQRISEAKQ